MDIKVLGGQVLGGEINASGSKNSAVAIIPATILLKGKIVLENIPEISDVQKLLNILTQMGSNINWNKEARTVDIDNSNVSLGNLTGNLLGNIRGTSLLWGPMLARFGSVHFDELPGGCTLGFRTLEPHYKAFRDMGVKVSNTRSSVDMNAANGKANTFWMSEASPTATENAIMMATSLSGTTKIIGAACEPQVQDLCQFLVACGIKIEGIGSNIISVTGGDLVSPGKYRIFTDHYEVATFLAMGAATGGEIMVNNAINELFYPIESVFSKFGIKLTYDKNSVKVAGGQKPDLKDDEGRGLLYVKAQPWPALPVDILPVFIPLALAAKSGQALFHNWMYEAGLFWTSELQKLGATVLMSDPHRVVVIAGRELKGATLEAPYIIRAVVAMLMASMIAKGESTILNADALYRGHPHFSENLNKLGAEITEINSSLDGNK